MTPDEPARGASSQASPDAVSRAGEEHGSRGRAVVTVLAVVLAAAGLLALAAILLIAFLGQDVWPGFVAVTYICLPLSFLLMVSLVVGSFLSRRRA